MTDVETAQQDGPDSGPESADAGDRGADLRAVLGIFCVLVLGAVHFISGWTFDF